MMQNVARRVRALEKELTSRAMSAAIPFIELEDAEWLLSVLDATDPKRGRDRFTPEQAARIDEMLSDALAAAAKYDPATEALIVRSNVMKPEDLQQRMAALPDEVKPYE